MIDLAIKGGVVVDGTGAPRFRADIGVSGGIIVEMGKVETRARRIIDATDLVVTPGFIDPHTHYDAQVCWDPLLTSSSWHGVTSVILGNCGVGVAPCRPDDSAREIVVRDLVNLEGIPLDALRQGVSFDWDSFPSYMGTIQKSGSAINLGFLAPLTAFRHWVLGTQSMERAATEPETAQIACLLREAVEAGALGLATSFCSIDKGFEGRPLACRLASRSELRHYANILRERGRGVIQANLTESIGTIRDEELEILDFLLTESGRPVTFSSLPIVDAHPQSTFEALDRLSALIARGASPQITCRPRVFMLCLAEPFIWSTLECVQPLLNRPPDVKVRAYHDPDFRAALREDMKGNAILGHVFRDMDGFRTIRVLEVHSDSMRGLEGRFIADIAEERGTSGLDTLFDIALQDRLQTRFYVPLYNNDTESVGRLIGDPRTLIGLSDGGAHVDQLCDAGYCTYILGTWVRERQVMSLEYAVKRLTSQPADLFGLRDRGRIVPGMAADLVVLDPARVGSNDLGYFKADLPGGAKRLVVESVGIYQTIVNGSVIVENGSHTGALPGATLRSA